MDSIAKSATCSPTRPADADAGAPPIDLEHLRRFTLGDRRLELEVLTLFIEQAPSTIEALGRARTHRDWRRAAHTLKGSARAVGAWRLARLAERAEGLEVPSDRSAAEQALRQITEAAAEARAHIVALKRCLSAP